MNITARKFEKFYLKFVVVENVESLSEQIDGKWYINNPQNESSESDRHHSTRSSLSWDENELSCDISGWRMMS